MGLKPLKWCAGEQSNALDERFSGTQQLSLPDVQRSHTQLCCSYNTNVQKVKAWINMEGLDDEKIITGCLDNFMLQARIKHL